MHKLILCLFLLLPLCVGATVRSINNSNNYVGVAADTKPIEGVQPGAVFYETDTTKVYFWAGPSDRGASTDWDEQKTVSISEDQTLNRTNINAGGTYLRRTTTGVVKASPGALVGFFLASTTACTVLLHDDPDSATAPIVLNTTAALTVLGWYPLPVTLTTGLFLTVGGTCDITFVII